MAGAREIQTTLCNTVESRGDEFEKLATLIVWLFDNDHSSIITFTMDAFECEYAKNALTRSLLADKYKITRLPRSILVNGGEKFVAFYSITDFPLPSLAPNAIIFYRCSTHPALEKQLTTPLQSAAKCSVFDWKDSEFVEREVEYVKSAQKS